MWKSALLAAAMTAGAAPGSGQSVVNRSPDLSGGWIGEAGRVYFQVMHRFDAGPAPARKVTNTPTIFVGAPVTGHALLGANYATSSNVARGRPNEWELFGRWAPLDTDRWDLALQAGYNLGAASVDGELTVATDLGAFRAMAVGRAFSGWRDTEDPRFAAGFGARIRLLDGLALAGDVVAPVDLASAESPAWSAGVQLRIPYTPHTLSLHASNAATTTLHGSTVGSGAVRYGFEFTVPITLRRYASALGLGGRPVSATPAPAADSGSRMGSGGMAAGSSSMDSMMATADTVEIHIEALTYGAERLEIGVGTTVVWVNDDPLAHTSTSDDALWDSELIQPGERWARTFTDPGEFAYHCTPHPFMTGVIVVRERGME